MATVGYKQRTQAFIRHGETAGGCEHCTWQGPWHPQDRDGVLAAAAEARQHLGDEHPRAVTYWEDLL